MANVPLVFYPFDQEDKEGQLVPNSRTKITELAELLSHALGAVAQTLLAQKGIEALVPPKARYGEPSMVVWVGGLPLVVTGSWVKSKIHYSLLVEAVFRESRSGPWPMRSPTKM